MSFSFIVALDWVLRQPWDVWAKSAEKGLCALEPSRIYPGLKPQSKCNVFLILWLCILHCGQNLLVKPTPLVKVCWNTAQICSWFSFPSHITSLLFCTQIQILIISTYIYMVITTVYGRSSWNFKSNMRAHLEHGAFVQK